MTLIGCEQGNETTERLQNYVETTLSSHTGIVDAKDNAMFESLEDGIYFAHSDHFSEESGYKEAVLLEVKDNELINLHLDAINTSAKLITVEEQATKTSSVSTTEQLNFLESYLFSNSQVDAINYDAKHLADLTINVEAYINLYTKALASKPIVIGAYQDGYYFIEAPSFTDGEKASLGFTVLNGNIIAVNFDILSEKTNTSYKQELTNGNDELESWLEQVNILEQHLVKTQNPTGIEYNENFTSNVLDEPCLFIGDFVKLAVDALASGPLLN